MAPKDEKEAVKISVETKDPSKKESNNKNKPLKDGELKEATMSEEDQELKERLETCVSTVVNKDSEEAVTVPLRLKALDVLVAELRSATSSMTSVPKPLKFLRPHFPELKQLHVELMVNSAVDGDSIYLLLRARLGDVLSVLAMTLGDVGEFCLFFSYRIWMCIGHHASLKILRM
jgi:26S proteasome regulatory subunit N1